MTLILLWGGLFALFVIFFIGVCRVTKSSEGWKK